MPQKMSRIYKDGDGPWKMIGEDGIFREGTQERRLAEQLITSKETELTFPHPISIFYISAMHEALYEVSNYVLPAYATHINFSLPVIIIIWLLITPTPRKKTNFGSKHTLTHTFRSSVLAIFFSCRPSSKFLSSTLN